MANTRIVLVEDDPDVLGRLSQLIGAHTDYILVAAAKDYKSGLDALLAHRPDVLLTDIGLPDGSGIDLIKAIATNKLDCSAMVVSGFSDEHIVFKALEAGASSYIHKHDESQKITDAIASMLNGGAPISPLIAKLMLQKFQRPTVPSEELPESLTERQVSILKLISQGFSSREISEKLDITYYTVTTHIKNVYTKLQVNSRTEAINEARRIGLL